MRAFLVASLGICLANSALALQQATKPYVPRPPYASSSSSGDQAERELLDLTNQSRAQSGLAPLQAEEGLARAARKHSTLMASQNQLSHDLPNEPALPQRLASTCTLELSAEGENVGFAASVAQAHRGFMNSPHHRENILNPNYNMVGFAVVRSGNMIYVTEDFAQTLPRRSAQQAEDLVAGSVARSRQNAGLPQLQRADGTAVESAACTMAHADALNPASVKGRYVVTYTSLQPEELPSSTAKAIRDGAAHSFAVGTCFARTSENPGGAYFIVLTFD
jgi:uncharacterized protein YkwD